MKRPLISATAMLFPLCGPAAAHSPLMSCFENEDKSVTCEAGYSDGASAANQVFRVYDVDGRLLLEGQFAGDSSYTFEAPAIDAYEMEFVGDDSHQITVFSDEVVPYE